MWCRNCNIETNEKNCPVCGRITEQDTPADVLWCNNCGIPVIQLANSPSREICPLCGKKIRHLSSDLRPVFPEERLLLAILLHEPPEKYMGCSCWAANSRYYVDGKPLNISLTAFFEADTDHIAKEIKTHLEAIDYTAFNESVARFTEANQHRLSFLKEETSCFVQNAAREYKEENIVISFSGGKDSTVTADVVTKALSNPSLVHIFGNTTLEFPATVAYANRFRGNHPLAIFMIAKNDEQVF